jgi:hypothetical protein
MRMPAQAGKKQACSNCAQRPTSPASGATRVRPTIPACCWSRSLLRSRRGTEREMFETPARCSLKSGEQSEAQVAAFVGATVALTGAFRRAIQRPPTRPRRPTGLDRKCPLHVDSRRRGLIESCPLSTQLQRTRAAVSNPEGSGSEPLSRCRRPTTFVPILTPLQPTIRSRPAQRLALSFFLSILPTPVSGSCATNSMCFGA